MVNKNALSVIAYFFGLLGGIVVFLVTDKKDKLVRFHAIQSVLFNVAAFVIGALLLGISMPFWFFMRQAPVFAGFGVLNGLYTVLVVLVWIVLMVRAWEGKKFKLPVLGDIAEDWSR